ncbi:MAG: MoxR family ATPase [Thermoguttaceae bacterium]
MSTEIPIGQQLDGFRKDFDALRREIGKAVVGQEPIVDGLLTAVVIGGHVLLEGVPGLGKTLLVETLAEVVKLTFQRVQFTPDLMPSDLLGTYVVMETPEGRRTFEFQKGPIFSHIVLADQINRGTPRTQSALLEAMEGQTISVSNETFDLPQPFFVLATQNPLEMEGTFPLPEPQIDRFLFKLTVTPPTAEQIEEILDRTTEGEPPVVMKVVDAARILEMREIARRVPIDANLRRQGVALVAVTHPDHARAPESVRRFVRYGSSPRGAQALILGAKVRAILEGRGEVSEQDLCAVAHAALRHRMVLNFEGQADAVQTDRIVDEILSQVFGPQGQPDVPAANP